MANIGDVLTSPEAGWKRISMTDSNIIYEGTGWSNNQGWDYITNILDGACIKFNIKGSKRVRIYGYSFSNRTNQTITINDSFTKTYSNSSGTKPYTLLFEKTDILPNNYIKIVPNKDMSSGVYFGIACIDIDENAEISPYDENIFFYLLKYNSQYYTIKNNSLLLLKNQVLDKANFENNGFKNLNLLTQENISYKETKQLKSNMCEFNLDNNIDEIRVSR